MARRCALVLGLVAGMLVPAAVADQQNPDGSLLRIVTRQVPALERAGRGALSADPDEVQAQYDAARDLEEAIGAVGPVSKTCGPLRSAASALARAHVDQAEAFDRQEPEKIAAARRRASSAGSRISEAREACAAGGSTAPRADTPSGTPLQSPKSGEVAYGSVRVRAVAPRKAIWAAIRTDGSSRCATPNVERITIGEGRIVDTRVSLASGPYDITLTFCGQGARPRVIRTDIARDVWVLPPSARLIASPRSPNASVSGRLRSAAASFTGYSAVWYHNLRTGETAEWNATARFPAASTVKLAVLVAALRTLGSDPLDGRYGHDLQAMAGWSSNLATNRLLERLGNGSVDRGSRLANGVLHQLGATSSAFTGGYRAGTSATLPNAEPPRVSSRVTTARDLGRLMYLIHAGSAGSRTALGVLKLDRHRAQLALSLLLASEPVSDNVGLIRGSVARTIPIAQKNGWLSDARHTAAVIYRPAAPEVVVVLTYRDGLSLSEASAYAADVLRAVR